MTDFVPEHCQYSDEGCDLFPSCLNCPLAACRYDQPGRQAGKELRNGHMLRLYGDGVAVGELARRFKVSTRTVYRVIARRKDGAGAAGGGR